MFKFFKKCFYLFIYLIKIIIEINSEELSKTQKKTTQFCKNRSVFEFF